MANWTDEQSGGARLSLAGGRLRVLVFWPFSGGGWAVDVFGSRMTQRFPDREVARRKGEEQARKVLEKALGELAATHKEG